MEPPPSMEYLLQEQEEEESNQQSQTQPQPPEDWLQTRAIKAKTSKQTTAASPPVYPQQPTDYLGSLNRAQLNAVMHSDKGGLQILAGPGSGKTKVLTSRVAYLIQHYGLAPETIVVVTFTNKAALEMKHRLCALLGPATISKLLLGTFHSVCVRYLRQYGSLLSLTSNFVVADRDDCLAILKRAIAKNQPRQSGSMTPESVARMAKELKPNTVCDIISKAKSRNEGPYELEARLSSQMGQDAREWNRCCVGVYVSYEAELKRDNALDFDDLLLYGHRLVKKFPHVVAKVKNVLIDEFQDTNVIQYQFVQCLARASKSLTIVGDPDQSIYGWRNADVENLVKMCKDFAPVTQIFLEENYRSTGAIVGAALAVVKQDPNRIQKKLIPTHPSGTSVVLHEAKSAFEEADFIAAQIKHLVAHTGNMIQYQDIAILLRYGAISRNIEQALQKNGIPSRMSGGHKFFERQEVKDVLSYLQIVDNEHYTAAFVRVVNVPKRGLGDKTVRELLAAGVAKNMSPFAVAKAAGSGSQIAGSVPQAQRKGLKAFCEVVEALQLAAQRGATVPDLIDRLLVAVGYSAHLEKTHSNDYQERLLNVQELKAYATIVAQENPGGVFGDSVVAGLAGDGGGDDSGFGASPVSSGSQSQSPAENPLRTFLAVSMLATDSETEDAKQDSTLGKVTISTCHSAKGLEWPVVFVPACEAGIYPFYRSTEANQVDEERRLLYVAITRAKAFCILTHSAKRMAGADVKNTRISPFLATVSKQFPTLFVPKLQKIGAKARMELGKVLARPAIDEAVVAKMIEEHTALLDPPYQYNNAPKASSQGLNRSFSQGSYSDLPYQRSQEQPRASGSGPVPVPANAGFKSANELYKTTPAQPAYVPGHIPAALKPAAPSTSQAKNLPAKDQPKLSFAARPLTSAGRIPAYSPSTQGTGRIPSAGGPSGATVDRQPQSKFRPASLVAAPARTPPAIPPANAVATFLARTYQPAPVVVNPPPSTSFGRSLPAEETYAQMSAGIKARAAVRNAEHDRLYSNRAAYLLPPASANASTAAPSVAPAPTPVPAPTPTAAPIPRPQSHDSHHAYRLPPLPPSSGRGYRLPPSTTRQPFRLPPYISGASTSTACNSAAGGSHPLPPVAAGSSSAGVKALPSTGRIVVPSKTDGPVLTSALAPTPAPVSAPVSAPIPALAPAPISSSSTPSKGGPLRLPETRASLIDAPVLINPVAPPLNPPNLVDAFQTKEAVALANLESAGAHLANHETPKPKGRGRPSKSSGSALKEIPKNVIASATQASAPAAGPMEVDAAVGGSAGRPMRGAAKRCLEGFEKTLVPKRARKSTGSRGGESRVDRLS